MNKKYVMALLCAGVLTGALMTGCAASDEAEKSSGVQNESAIVQEASDADKTGQSEAQGDADGNTAMEPPQGAEGGMPPEMPEGADGGTPPERPDGEGGAPPDLPDGENGGMPPGQPGGENGGTPPERPDGESGGMPPGQFDTGSIDHGTYAAVLTENVAGETFVSTADQENAVRIEGDVEVSLEAAVINKIDGEAGAGDASNFYGVNAGLLALDGAEASIENSTITTTVNGANGIFSYGEGTVVRVSDSEIATDGDQAGGIMVAGGGTMYVTDCDIETQGQSSAALRTDRGGGTLIVDGGTYVAHGVGSPAIYCTADIDVESAVLTATGSEGIVVEGKNSVALVDCDVTGNMQNKSSENLQNVMIYQSMSGDADVGKSAFSMTGGSMVANSGDMFYITNTSSEVYLSSVAFTPYNDVFMRIAGNSSTRNWGTPGENGGTCDLTAENQSIDGIFIVDEISSLTLRLEAKSVLTGAINLENEGGAVSVTLDENSVWKLTGDSYITELGGHIENIEMNGYTLYVNGSVFEG